MARTRLRQQPPLKRLSERQKHGDLARLVSTSEATIAADYATAQQTVRGILAQFAAALATEQQRLADLHGEEDASQVRVPLAWLKTSGWGLRVRHALQMARASASHTSRRAIVQGMRVAHGLGTQNARELLTLAMRPAIRAGMTHWRPK